MKFLISRQTSEKYYRNSCVKLFILIIALVTAPESIAQTFGVKAGLNLSDILLDNETFGKHYSYNYHYLKPGFHLGATVEFLKSNKYSVETGFLLSTKGYKRSYEYLTSLSVSDKINGKDIVNLNYLDIPINAKISFKVGDVKVYSTFGPQIGIGISGKIKTKIIHTEPVGTSNSEYDYKLEWVSGENNPFSNNYEYKRIDFGLNAGAGVEINAIQIGLSYNFGLENLAFPGKIIKSKFNRVLGFSFGYRFIRK